MCLHALPLTKGQHTQDRFLLQSACLTRPASGLMKAVICSCLTAEISTCRQAGGWAGLSGAGNLEGCCVLLKDVSPEAVHVEHMVAAQLLVARVGAHLLAADDADVVCPLQLLWRGIQETLLHVGCHTPVSKQCSTLGV